MNERGLEEDDKKKANSDEDEIEHTLGPNVSRLHTLHIHVHCTSLHGVRVI